MDWHYERKRSGAEGFLLSAPSSDTVNGNPLSWQGDCALLFGLRPARASLNWSNLPWLSPPPNQDEQRSKRRKVGRTSWMGTVMEGEKVGGGDTQREEGQVRSEGHREVARVKWGGGQGAVTGAKPSGPSPARTQQFRVLVQAHHTKGFWTAHKCTEGYRSTHPCGVHISGRRLASPPPPRVQLRG